MTSRRLGGSGSGGAELTTLKLRYRIVDVFSDKPLAGNALCVVIDECPEPLMQAIARETKLSETTFPVVTGQDAYRMRLFTPAVELPFAGHPSLGTAWVLGPRRWTQSTSGATVTIEADADGAVMGQPDPVFDEVDPEPAAKVLGLTRPTSAWTATAAGLWHLILTTDAPIDELTPDISALPYDRTTAVVRRLDDRTLQVRVFLAGIGEDPGTGSAAGPIAMLARRVWGTDADVTIRQGDEIGRPCRIVVHAEAGAITVGGRVAPCAEGHFTLPEG